MRARIDPRICAQLDISRSRWVTRAAEANWTDWVARTSASAFRDISPEIGVIRIHSLPGTTWEALHDASGDPHLIADDELVASLAELRLLSNGAAPMDAGYDRMMLLLADGFRSIGNPRYYAACVGSLVPRRVEILETRRASLSTPAFSADSVVVLLHELAHQVLRTHPEATQTWLDLSALAVGKVVDALTNSELRDRAINDGLKMGLTLELAAAQIQTYLSRLQSSPKLQEELTCDLLATLGFLNLRTTTNLLADSEPGPAGVSTKEVGDALLVAHGTIQNLQLIAAAEEIAATVLDPVRQRGVPGATMLEFTARSSALVFLLSNLLRAWCASGSLNDTLATRIAGGEPQFQAAVAKRNAVRKHTVLDPLEALDGILIDEDRFAQFEIQALSHLDRAGIHATQDLQSLETLRWQLTSTEPVGR